MTSLRLSLIAAASLAFALPAGADVIHLKNGRTMEGEVVRRTADSIELKVRGGSMVLPRSVVDHIEERLRPQDEYANRVRKVDPSDPDELEELSLWASSRGLGDEAHDLNSQALGIRLDRRVDRIRSSRRAQDWVDLYRWAQNRDLSGEVQDWLLARGEQLDPDHLGVRTALRERELEVEQLEREANARAERKAVSYVDRKRERLAQLKRQRERDAEQQRLAQLEEQVAQQQERINELEERPVRVTRRRRRARGYGGGVVVGGRLPTAYPQPGVTPLPLPEEAAPPPPVRVSAGRANR